MAQGGQKRSSEWSPNCVLLLKRANLDTNSDAISFSVDKWALALGSEPLMVQRICSQVLLGEYYKNSRMVRNASSLSQGFIPIRREGSGLVHWHPCLSSTGQLREPWAARALTCGRSCLTGEVGVKRGERQMTLWSLSLTSEITSLLAQAQPLNSTHRASPGNLTHDGVFHTGASLALPLLRTASVGAAGCTVTRLPMMANQQAGTLRTVVFGSD